MASEVRADAEVAEDAAGTVGETDQTERSAGGRSPSPVGASGVSEPDPGSVSAEAAEAANEAEAAEAEGDETEGESAERGVNAGAQPAGAVTRAAEPAEPAGPAEAPRTKRRIGVVLLFAALALVIDVTSKAIVVAQLQNRGPIHVTGGFLNLTLIRNSGAAFSIGESQTWVFTVIAAGVVFVILRVSRHLRSLPWAIALGLLLGGALGNLSDRLFRSPGVGRGDVVDFLQFPTFPLVHYDFPVFNLADSAIVVGGCLMVLLSFLGMQPDGTRHKDVKPEAAAPQGVTSDDASEDSSAKGVKADKDA